MTVSGDRSIPSARQRGRLTRPAQFEAVLAGGRRSGSRCFLARALENGEGAPRLGLIVGKKAAPRAVDRNRVKRLAREAYGRLAAELGSIDVVIQLRSSPRGRDNAELFKELERVMRGLLQDGTR